MAISGPEANNWLAGQHPGGARYGISDPVIIEDGPCAGHHGTVVTLAELVPEPTYLIEIEAGHYVQARQSQLREGLH